MDLMGGMPKGWTYGAETQLMRERREQEERDAKARRKMDLRKIRARTEAMHERAGIKAEEREQAKRDLIEHAHELAVERERARARNEPNPWLKPGDSGYVSPEEFAIRRQLEQREAERSQPIVRALPMDAQDAGRAQRAADLREVRMALVDRDSSPSTAAARSQELRALVRDRWR